MSFHNRPPVRNPTRRFLLSPKQTCNTNINTNWIRTKAVCMQNNIGNGNIYCPIWPIVSVLLGIHTYDIYLGHLWQHHPWFYTSCLTINHGIAAYWQNGFNLCNHMHYISSISIILARGWTFNVIIGINDCNGIAIIQCILTVRHRHPHL